MCSFFQQISLMKQLIKYLLEIPVECSLYPQRDFVGKNSNQLNNLDFPFTKPCLLSLIALKFATFLSHNILNDCFYHLHHCRHQTNWPTYSFSLPPPPPPSIIDLRDNISDVPPVINLLSSSLPVVHSPLLFHYMLMFYFF